MSPVLLESKDIIKLTLVIVVIVPALFVSGFIFGYQRAEQHGIQQQASIAIDIPDSVTASLGSREPVVPQVIAPGHEIDVDIAGTDTAEQTAHAHDTPVEAAPATDDSEELADQVPENNDTPAEAQRPLAIGGPHEPAQQEPGELLLDTADESSASYTVQVGTFGSASNAERKVESLLSQNLNAYSTEVTGKQDRQLFNVRFGYFDNRKNARSALQAYKELFAEEGYLVRIKR